MPLRTSRSGGWRATWGENWGTLKTDFLQGGGVESGGRRIEGGRFGGWPRGGCWAVGCITFRFFSNKKIVIVPMVPQSKTWNLKFFFFFLAASPRCAGGQKVHI